MHHIIIILFYYNNYYYNKHIFIIIIFNKYYNNNYYYYYIVRCFIFHLSTLYLTVFLIYFISHSDIVGSRDVDNYIKSDIFVIDYSNE